MLKPCADEILTLVSQVENSVDPDQMASTVFSKEDKAVLSMK